jgi:hypothetical protein
MASLWLNHPEVEGEEIPDIVGHDGSYSSSSKIYFCLYRRGIFG